MFNTAIIWDEFWYHENNTLLLITEAFTLGYEQLDIARIRTEPEYYRHVDRLVKSTFMGIPTEREDQID